MTTTPTHTRSESIVMWQWNGWDDNRGVVHCYPSSMSGWLDAVDGFRIIHLGDWIIERTLKDGTKAFEVITDAEKQAQGWKEVAE